MAEYDVAARFDFALWMDSDAHLVEDTCVDMLGNLVALRHGWSYTAGTAFLSNVTYPQFRLLNMFCTKLHLTCADPSQLGVGMNMTRASSRFHSNFLACINLLRMRPTTSMYA